MEHGNNLQPAHYVVRNICTLFILMECCLNFYEFVIFFQYFMFSLRFMLFATSHKKLAYKKFRGGGGGGVDFFFFFRKTSLSHFTFYAIFNIKK